MTPVQTNPPNRLLAVLAVLLGCVIGITLDHAAAEQTGMKRTILLRTDDPAGATYEAVMGIAELTPGANSGKHLHHGVEIGYVLDGSLLIEYEGRPSITVNAGEAFKNVGPHMARNPGNKSTKILAVYLVEKGKALADPMP